MSRIGVVLNGKYQTAIDGPDWLCPFHWGGKAFLVAAQWAVIWADQAQWTASSETSAFYMRVANGDDSFRLRSFFFEPRWPCRRPLLARFQEKTPYACWIPLKRRHYGELHVDCYNSYLTCEFSSFIILFVCASPLLAVNCIELWENRLSCFEFWSRLLSNLVKALNRVSVADLRTQSLRIPTGPYTRLKLLYFYIVPESNRTFLWKISLDLMKHFELMISSNFFFQIKHSVSWNLQICFYIWWALLECFCPCRNFWIVSGMQIVILFS